MRRLAALFIALSPIAAAAQPQPPHAADAAAAAQRMRPFEWLVGEWRGSGWAMGPDGARHSFASYERVSPKLGGAALFVEGRHTAADDPSRVIHDAMAMLVWDSRANGYRFRTALSTGMGGDFPIAPNANGFTWRIDAPGGAITYDVTRENGRWIERGRRALPNGQSVQFFEMTLERVPS